MSNLRLKDHTWDAANIYDSALGETQEHINASLAGKQETLVSGETIKTVNGVSILGSGNIEIQGGGGSGVVVDDTLSIAGAAADAKKTGDEIGNLKSQLGSYEDDALKKEWCLVQRPENNAQFVANGVNVKQFGTKVILDGTASSATTLYLNYTHYQGRSRYGIGFSNNFFTNVNGQNILSVIPGHSYKIHCKLISGSVTRGGQTYYSEEDFARNVVNCFLMKSDATLSTDRYFSGVGESSFTINENEIGTLVLYIYENLIADNAVFEVWLQDWTARTDVINSETQNADKRLNNVVKYTNDSFRYPATPAVTINNRTVNGVTVSADGRRVYLDGTASDNLAIILNYSANMLGIYQGFSPAFNSRTSSNPITPGRNYRIHFKMIDGSISRTISGTTYILTPGNFQYIGKKIINIFLTAVDRNTDSIMTAGPGYIENGTRILNINEFGDFVLYVYSGVVIENAVFECWLEDVDEVPLDDYWEVEVERARAQIINNIMASPEESSTTCFVTDCHWASNYKKSPMIIKKLIQKCPINYFVNGGDMINSHKSTKAAAVQELTDCVNAFSNCGLPMFSVYGNHDRNRNGNDDETTYLTATEHLNLVLKTALIRPEVHFVTNGHNYYWEDKYYRYICLYWYSSSSHDLPGIEEFTNTDKKLVIFCHGIYFSVKDDKSEDVIDNQWILNAFEPYKDKIRCFIQGHTHRDALRHAYSNNVPIVIISCDKANELHAGGTIKEQSVAVITINNEDIKVVRVGFGTDFVVTSNTGDFALSFENGDPVLIPSV